MMATTTPAANANLALVLGVQAAARPDAVALRGRDGRAVTFAELDALAARGAALFQARGLRAGDAVLVFQPMSVELYVALLAIFRLGLTAMFLDPSAGRAHLARCCALTPPRGLLGPPRAHGLRFVSGALRRIPAKFVTGRWQLPGAWRWEMTTGPVTDDGVPPSPEIAVVGENTPALLTFTSGSTGEPKAAVRTHGFLRAQHRALATSLALEAGETDLATLPIFVLANLASGVSTLLADADLRRPGEVDPTPIARQVTRHRPTRVAASPAFFERLLEDDGENHTAAVFGGFRKLYTGGAPVFPDLLARLRAATGPAAEIVAVYGSTEAEPMAELPEREITAADLAAMRAGRGLLAGRSVPSVQLRIIADRWGTPLETLTPGEFDARVCPPGTPGEVVVCGKHVLSGYLHGRGNEETKFRVGAGGDSPSQVWHRTGDAGTFDDVGRLWLLGRCAARVQDQHGTVYPFGVECAALTAAPFVRRCAFLAVCGERWLVVEPREPSRQSVTPEKLEDLRHELGWAWLARVYPVRRIPVDRRHQAKVDYPALRKLLRVPVTQG